VGLWWAYGGLIYGTSSAEGFLFSFLINGIKNLKQPVINKAFSFGIIQNKIINIKIKIRFVL